MPINPDHVGRTYPPTDPYEVSSAKITEYATAIGDDNVAYRGAEQMAPPTFAVVVAAAAWEQFFADPELDVALARVVHADQRFVWHRPLRPGDKVVGVLTIDSVRQRGPAEFIGITVSLQSEAAEPLCEASSTFVHTRQAS